MAYDEELAERVRFELEGTDGLTERRMFGGLGFMVQGNMALAASGRGGLLVRVDPAEGSGWIDGSGVAPMEMRGRAMSGWLHVAPAVLDDAGLTRWMARGLTYAQSLPPK